MSHSIVHAKAWIFVFTGYLLLLLVSGYRFQPSLILTIYVFGMSLAGQVIYTSLLKRQDCNFLEILGAGISIGTFVPSVLGFFVKSYTRLPLSLVPAVFIALALVLHFGSSTKHDPANDNNLSTLALLTVAATSFSFAQFAHWFYIPGLVIALLLACSQVLKVVNRTLIRVSGGLILFSCSALLIFWLYQTLAAQPLIWRQLTYIDQIFDETQSWSLARYGFKENAFAVGNNMPGHTLSQTWAGLTQNILQSPSFMTSGSGGILLAILGTCALLAGFAYRTHHTVKAVVGTFVVWALQMSVLDQFGIAPNPRIANSLSLLWFLSALVLLIEHKNKQLRFSVVIIPVFVAFLALSKIHWAIFILASFGILSSIEFLKGSEKKNLLISVFSAIGVALIYFSYLRGLNAYSNPVVSFSVSAFVLYIAVFLNRSLGFFAIDTTTDQKYIQKLLGISIVLFSLLISTTGTSNQQTYFVTCSLILISMLHGPQIIHQFSRLFLHGFALRLFLFFFTLLTLFLSLMATGFYWRLYESSISSDSARLLFRFVSHQEIYVLILTLMVSVLVSFFLAPKAFSVSAKRNFAVVLTSLLFIVNFSALIAQSTRTLITDRLHGRQMAELALSDEQLSLGQWIRANTNQDVILASNHYCQVLVVKGSRVPISPEECRHKNMNAWLSAISQRRLLLEAPIVSILGPAKILNADETQIFNLSLLVGQKPSELVLSALEKLGVEMFVASNEYTDLESLKQLRIPIYSNSKFTIFQLG